MLYSTLNFHPDIACGGEWTQYVPWHKKLAVTERALSGDFSDLTAESQQQIRKLYTPSVRWLGFKILFRSSEKWLVHPRVSPALWLDRVDGFLGWLSRNPNVHVIHIQRTDAVDWLKSRYLSRKTGMFSFRSYPEGTKVQIPLRGAIKQLRSKDWVDMRLAGAARSNPYLSVSYEDFMESRDAVIGELMQFLGCDVSDIGEIDYGGLVKQSKGPARNYIANYEDLVAKLHESGMCDAAQ